MSQISKSKCRIRKGDEVIVLTGRARGMTGKVESVHPENDQVFIAGVNLFKKHTKPSMANPSGGIVDKPMPLHVSNVAIIDPKDKKATRVGYKIQDGQKIRVAKRSQSVI